MTPRWVLWLWTIAGGLGLPPSGWWLWDNLLDYRKARKGDREFWLGRVIAGAELFLAIAAVFAVGVAVLFFKPSVSRTNFTLTTLVGMACLLTILAYVLAGIKIRIKRSR